MDQLGVEGVEEGQETPQSHVVPVKWLCVQHLALGNHIFTVNSSNKARDGDTLCTTKEAMVTYIGINYGEYRIYEQGVCDGGTHCTKYQRYLHKIQPSLNIKQHAARVSAHRTHN